VVGRQQGVGVWWYGGDNGDNDLGRLGKDTILDPSSNFNTHHDFLFVERDVLANLTRHSASCLPATAPAHFLH